MASDDERRRVAAAFRSYEKETTNRGFASLFDVLDACGLTYYDGVVLYERLADLIDPDTATDTTKAPTSSDTAPTRTDATATCDMSHSRRDAVACDPTERGIDSVYEWCRGLLEGADGAEDYLYCSIMSAIEEYRHPERVTARTARPVDREALLALADEMDQVTCDNRGEMSVSIGDVWCWAGRIREACGEVAS